MAKKSSRGDGAYSEAMKGQGTGLPSFGKPLPDDKPSAGSFKRDTPLSAGGSKEPK